MHFLRCPIKSLECNILSKLPTEIEQVGINDTEECENTVLTQSIIFSNKFKILNN